MSTFDGFVLEFPRIRIDQFRTLPLRPPPLACFLSHVHSDHLVGLESFKTPFIYCSAATRELVLRLEKYPHRMNFSKGILECRKQTYKHLSKVLRPLPLDTPTRIQLSPGNEIQVTLLDANHCLGAVMFLIEGQGKAILYTGDVRAERWWIDSMTRHPCLIGYITPRRRLTKMYLDTTFATKSDPYRNFPSKAEGIHELLEALTRYPDNFQFYFHAWTFGYEDVWRTLSQVLQSQIHLDRYRYNIYTSIGRGSGSAPEAPSLCGFVNGNEAHPGILTRNPTVRIHSCERGTGCHVHDNPDKEIVDILPIISRHQGVEMRELGAGGGQGDLNQNHELDLSNILDLEAILAMCAKDIKDENELESIVKVLQEAMNSTDRRIQLDTFEDFKLPETEDDAIPLDLVPKIIASLSKAGAHARDPDAIVHVKPSKHKQKPRSHPELPRTITFPYSRHSSYAELRNLVAAFRPGDVWPCTAPPPHQWEEEGSMEALFGDLCETFEGKIRGFEHDVLMRQLREERMGRSVKRKRNMESDDETEPAESQRLEESQNGHPPANEEDEETASETEFHDAPERKTSLSRTADGSEPVQSVDCEAPVEKRIPSRTHATAPARAYHNEITATIPASDPSTIANPTTTLHDIATQPVSPPAQRYDARKRAAWAALSGSWAEDVRLSSVYSQPQHVHSRSRQSQGKGAKG